MVYIQLPKEGLKTNWPTFVAFIGELSFVDEATGETLTADESFTGVINGNIIQTPEMSSGTLPHRMLSFLAYKKNNRPGLNSGEPQKFTQESRASAKSAIAACLIRIFESIRESSCELLREKQYGLRQRL